MKKSDKKKSGIQEVAEMARNLPGLLFIVANPKTDEMLVAYAKKYAFMKFAPNTHVVQRVVSEEMFELSIDEFVSGLMEACKTDEERGVQFIKATGGAIRAIGHSLAEDYAKTS